MNKMVHVVIMNTVIIMVVNNNNKVDMLKLLLNQMMQHLVEVKKLR